MTKSYNQVITSKSFKENLQTLNNELHNVLINHGYEPRIIGNLFYAHCRQTSSLTSSLYKECEIKRQRFIQAIQNKKHMFEIGINGGHSSLLALEGNDKIIIYANDIAQFYEPIKWAHPEIYVPKACKTLKHLYQERFNYIFGDCLEQVPAFVQNNPNIKFDFVHLDGAKNTYTSDFNNLYKSMADGCTVIFDDFNEKVVQHQIQRLLDNKVIVQHKDFDLMSEDEKFTNYIATKI